MSDSTRRSLRVCIDVILAGLTSGLVEFLVAGRPDAARWVGIVAVLVPLFTKLRNAGEDAGLIPAVGKAPPSSGVNRAPDNVG